MAGRHDSGRNAVARDVKPVADTRDRVSGSIASQVAVALHFSFGRRNYCGPVLASIARVKV
jgi:hypothetical protein